MNYSVEDFFSKKFENESNEILLEQRWLFSEKAVEDYVIQLSDIKLLDYLSFFDSNPHSNNYSSRDITQLSSIYDCTFGMCKALKGIDYGLSFAGIAEKLHDGQYYKYNSGALTKYGENQVKTASQLGLTFCQKELWYLSAIGNIFLNLSDEIQNKYFSISLIRDPFYGELLSSLCKQVVKLEDYMQILSESTRKRRRSSCIKLINLFISQCEKEGIPTHALI